MASVIPNNLPFNSSLLSGLVLVLAPSMAFAHGMSPIYLLYFAWFAVFPFLLALHVAKSDRSFLRYQLPVAFLGIVYFFVAGGVFALAPKWFPVFALVIPAILKFLDKKLAKKQKERRHA